MYNDEKEKVTRDDVLSLDIATHCGFYSVYEAGTWDLTKYKRTSNGDMTCTKFDEILTDFIKKHNIKRIVAEDVSCGRAAYQFIATRKLSEFRGVLRDVCGRLGLPEPAFVNPKTVKNWATGNGNADKKMMMEYCIKRWGIDPHGDDNMADATHIWKYYVRVCDL